MKELVMDVINISGQAAIIFAVLLAVRGIFALGRVPKKYAYGLWAILFIRLLLPLQMEARWGLMPQESGLVRAVENMLYAAHRDAPDVLGNPAGDGQDVQGPEISVDWKSMFGRKDISANGYSHFFGFGILLRKEQVDTSHDCDGVDHGADEPNDWKGDDLIHLQSGEKDPQPSGRHPDQDPAADRNPYGLERSRNPRCTHERGEGEG